MNAQCSTTAIKSSPLIHSANNDNLSARDYNTEPSNITKTAHFPSKIASLLSHFESHGLKDLNNANLMNRVDSKFLLPLSFLPTLLESITNDYSVLTIDDKNQSNYHNFYFDTPKMSFYRDHHNGKLNRFKVRHRSYLDTKTEFLEVKFKNNKKRTLKSRIKLNSKISESSQNEKCKQFINEQMGETFEELIISQQGGYRRIALASEERAERLTLDFDLWFQKHDSSKQNLAQTDINKITLPNFFIAELKQNKRTKRSPAYQVLSKYGYVPTSFSKYCIGCALLYGQSVKQNKFKSTLLKIDKLSQSTTQLSSWN